MSMRPGLDHWRHNCDRDVWFGENSRAQAALARVLELANEWEHSGRPRIGGCEAAAELRAAIEGGAAR